MEYELKRMDEIDKKILEELQKNASIPLSELSKKVGLSNTPCWNRIKKMEEDKVILSRTCLLYTSPSPRDVEESRMPSSA